MSNPTLTTTPSIQGLTAPSNPSIITNTQSGRGSGTNIRQNTRSDHRNEKAAAFKEGTSDINGRVFQYCNKTTDPKTFLVILEKLTNYTSNTLKSAADFDPIFKRFATPHINKLIKPELIDAVDIAIFNQDVKYLVKRRNTLTDNVEKKYPWRY